MPKKLSKKATSELLSSENLRQNLNLTKRIQDLGFNAEIYNSPAGDVIEYLIDDKIVRIWPNEPEYQNFLSELEGIKPGPFHPLSVSNFFNEDFPKFVPNLLSQLKSILEISDSSAVDGSEFSERLDRHVRKIKKEGEFEAFFPLLVAYVSERLKMKYSGEIIVIQNTQFNVLEPHIRLASGKRFPTWKFIYEEWLEHSKTFNIERMIEWNSRNGGREE